MLADATVLVIGSGRIGSSLTRQLRALGCRVCVASRGAAPGPDRVPTGAYGPVLGQCDAVVNTAPALVLDAAALAQTRPDCLILDLASVPGGVDFDAAAQLGHRARWELSLPGRMFPRSAGRIIKEAVLRALRTPPRRGG